MDIIKKIYNEICKIELENQFCKTKKVIVGDDLRAWEGIGYFFDAPVEYIPGLEKITIITTKGEFEIK